MVSVHCGRVRRFLKDTKGVFSLVSVSEDLELKKNGPVVYWMSRDQRADDNWALLYARELANQTSVALEVVFNLVPKFLEATERQYEFMLKGLEETEITLRKKSIPFHLLMGHPKETMPNFIHSKNASALVTDFSPLRTPKAWSEEVAKKLDENVPMFVVDAHNVVPVWITSDKQEYAARTIRSKINKKAPEYLVEFPELEKNSKQFIESLPEPVDWKKARKSLEIDRTLKPVDWILPGSSEGKKVLQEFCTDRLPDYADKRNDPLAGVLSNLSPYFHFGQIAPQRAIMEVQKYAKKHSNCSESMKAFVEETMIRRELSDNFCYYQQNYDNIDGASDWAKETLKAHAKDKREYVYTQEEFEQAKTHSKFWNAMQTQLILEGKLHGYLRMMWAKNILEWTSSPEEALRIAIYLNDRYNIDGRDPNGYVGCMWSICGIHDQGWKEREIFGKIRCMKESGCRRKFKVDDFIKRYYNPKSSGKRSIHQFFTPEAKKAKTE